MELAAIIVVACIVIGVGYNRWSERELVRRIDAARHDPKRAADLLNAEIERDRATAEFWKKQSGRRL
jgi:hypothetical protein